MTARTRPVAQAVEAVEAGHADSPLLQSVGGCGQPGRGMACYLSDRIQYTIWRAWFSDTTTALGGMAMPVAWFFQWLE